MLQQQLDQNVLILSHLLDQPHTRMRVAFIKRIQKLYPLHEAIRIFELKRDVIAHRCCKLDRV